MRQVWTVPGGVHPPENKHQSMQEPLADCSLADEYILPLNQHIGAPAAPLVEVGDTVKKYQCIAEPEGVFSAGVHAPTSGKVIAIEERFIAHPSGLKAPCIVIAADGHDSAYELTPCDTPFALEHEAIISRIRAAGLAGMGGAGFPSAVKLNPRANTPIDTLILNGTECEPYITADDMLMQTAADDVIHGARLLAHTLNNPKNIIIGVEDNKPDAIAALTRAAQKYSPEYSTQIEVVSFPTKYPSGGEKQLIYILTGKEVASGKLPSDLGIVVQNVGTAAAAWRAVRYGEPLIERITTVVGEALGTQRNMKVRIGTPISHILEENGFQAPSHSQSFSSPSPRLIVGGPMMGFAIEQTTVPVVKTTNCVIAPSQAEMPEAPPQQACIRCGHCAEACPAGLLPQQLYWYARAEEHDKLQSHNLFDCIECGACSYVCPSAIPLVQYYRNAKGTIRQAEADKLKADKARLRFEQRQARIAKIEEAKEAKRLARKAAAEKNKAKAAKQAAEAASATGSATDDKSDLVSKAIHAAKAQQSEITPEQERAKLSRTFESLKSRIEKTEQQIKDATGDTSRTETLNAKLKQTQLKIKEAEQKLANFDAQSSTGRPVSPGSGSSLGQAAQKQSAAASSGNSSKPATSAEKTVLTLRKRIATAKEKLAEAKAEQKTSADALEQGVKKLEDKLADALKTLDAKPESLNASAPKEAAPLDAASAAILKAQEKAKAAASLTPEEKQAAAILSLEKRIEKAKDRLKNAQQNNDDNIEAFTTGLQKLEDKLAKLKN